MDKIKGMKKSKHHIHGMLNSPVPIHKHLPNTSYNIIIYALHYRHVLKKTSRVSAMKYNKLHYHTMFLLSKFSARLLKVCVMCCNYVTAPLTACVCAILRTPSSHGVTEDEIILHFGICRIYRVVNRAYVELCYMSKWKPLLTKLNINDKLHKSFSDILYTAHYNVYKVPKYLYN